MNSAETIKFVEETFITATQVPVFKAGDTITVQYKIREGSKERIQNFQGVVLQRSGKGVNETFTVRKISGNILSTPTFPDIFLTVNVSFIPFPERCKTTPWKF